MYACNKHTKFLSEINKCRQVRGLILLENISGNLTNSDLEFWISIMKIINKRMIFFKIEIRLVLFVNRLFLVGFVCRSDKINFHTYRFESEVFG